MNDSQPQRRIDATDLLFAVGFITLTTGLYLISLPLALIIGGSLLILTAALAIANKKHMTTRYNPPKPNPISQEE